MTVTRSLSIDDVARPSALDLAPLFASAGARILEVCASTLLTCRAATSLGLRDHAYVVMPYVSPAASPASTTIDTPLCSPRDVRASGHWGQQPPAEMTNGGCTPPRRHSRSHSHDFLTGPVLSPPPRAMIFLQPASPSPLNEEGPVHPKSAAAALNASYEAPPPAISPRSSPSAQRLQLHAAAKGIDFSVDNTDWPEGDPTSEDGSPVASTSALPPIANTSANQSASASTSSVSPHSPIQAPFSPQKLHLRGAAARSKSSPGLPASALRRGIEQIASQRKTPSPKPIPMIRKKSGELVRSSLKGHSSSSLRLATLQLHNEKGQPQDEVNLDDDDEETPSEATINKPRTRETRARSMPATPTERKHVLFDDHLEHIKLFRSEQRPAAVSRTGSPTETETEEESEGFPFPTVNTSGRISLTVPDLPTGGISDNDWRDVMLEQVEMSVDQRNLRGTVFVRNLSLHKRVVVRFTVDDWQTVSEVTGEYVTAVRSGAYDRWAFTIKLQDMLARIESTVLLLAVRYNVDGRELWDSNHGRNYRVTFKRDPAPAAPTRKQMASSVRSAQTQRYNFQENHQQNDTGLVALQDRLERLADDYHDDDEEVKKPLRAQAPAQGSGFSTRYDFGASFKAGRNQTLLQNPFFHPQSGAISPSGSPLAPTKSLTTPGMIPMPPSHFVPTGNYIPVSAQPALSPLTAPPQPLYPRRESNGVIHTDYGLPQHLFDAFPQHRPPTPPDEEAGPHSPYHRSPSYDGYDAVMTPKAIANGFNTYPQSRGHAGAEHLSLLMGPRRHTKGSPPPQDSPTESVTPSESTTPQSDAGDASPPQLRGSYSDLPGLVASTVSASSVAAALQAHSSGVDAGILRDLVLSPTSSTETAQSSPESPTRSGTPPSSTASPESSRLNVNIEGEVTTYDGFLERYCWQHQSSQPSALGLTDVPRHLISPQPRVSTTSFFIGSGRSPSQSGTSSPVSEDNHHIGRLGEYAGDRHLHGAGTPIVGM